jgi:hypothetical protein
MLARELLSLGTGIFVNDPIELSYFLGGLLAGRLGFEYWQGKEIFPFSVATRSAVESNHPPIQWASGALFPGVKGTGRETDHSLTSGPVVKDH